MAEINESKPENHGSPEGNNAAAAEVPGAEMAQQAEGAGLAASEREKELELRFTEQLEKAQGLEKSLQDMEKKLEKTQGELGEAAEHYKSLVFALHPDIPAELITGSSIPEINASLEKARALVEKIKDSLLKQGKASIPAGAPARSSPDWSSLSPREKIKVGIQSRQR